MSNPASCCHCSECNDSIGLTWIQVIVQEEDEGELIHTVGFLCSEECLLDYAAAVGGLMMEENDE